uniref:NR LBD domain-containing protein n=1 Tax=Panagrolaimus superbus TaxID=310955 RepID=A0A914Y403_9BILA
MNAEVSTLNIKICEICGSKSDGLHYDNRVMCRSCRYKKCLEKGMLTSSVNEPFDSIGGKRQIIPERNDDQNTTLNNTNVLEKIVNDYRNFLFLRKASSAFASFEKDKSRTTSTYKTSRKQCCVESSLIKDILINFFHPYSTLTETDQTALFDKFYSRFSNFERAFSTYKNFGNIEGNQNLIMPDGNSININELSKYYENCTKTDPLEVAKIFYPSMAYIINDIVPFMSKITVDEYEICAIFGILLWQNRTLQFSEITLNLFHETRNEIFKNLNQYYQSQGKSVEEIVVKIGNIMLLNTKIEHSINMVKENREVAEIFDMIEFDNCCRE